MVFKTCLKTCFKICIKTCLTGKKGLKHPTVVLISPDLIITFMVFTLSVRSQLRTSPADCGWRYAKPRQSKLGIILIIVNAHCMYNVHCTCISTCLCGKIWQSLNVYCSPNLIYKHKRNPELLVFWLVAHERKKSTHTCTCLPAQRQIMSNLILLLILFYVGHMYEVISSYIFG